MTLLIPRRAIVRWSAPSYSAGKPIAPTPTMKPGNLARSNLRDGVLVRGVERVEVERVGALDVRHEQRARAVALLDVDREPEVHVLVVHDGRLTVDDLERGVHHRDARQRLEHRVRDQVGEADLAAADAREMVVEDLPVDLEQLGGNRSHRRGRRDLERGLHVLDDPRRCAADGDRLVGRVVHLRSRHGLRYLGSGGRRSRRRGRGGCRRGGGRRRRCRGRVGSGRRRCRQRGQLPAGKELAPPVAHGVGVLEVLAVHLLRESGVGAQILECLCHGSLPGGLPRTAAVVA